MLTGACPQPPPSRECDESPIYYTSARTVVSDGSNSLACSHICSWLKSEKRKKKGKLNAFHTPSLKCTWTGITPGPCHHSRPSQSTPASLPYLCTCTYTCTQHSHAHTRRQHAQRAHTHMQHAHMHTTRTHMHAHNMNTHARTCAYACACTPFLSHSTDWLCSHSQGSLRPVCSSSPPGVSAHQGPSRPCCQPGTLPLPSTGGNWQPGPRSNSHWRVAVGFLV